MSEDTQKPAYDTDDFSAVARYIAGVAEPQSRSARYRIRTQGVAFLRRDSEDVSGVLFQLQEIQTALSLLRISKPDDALTLLVQDLTVIMHDELLKRMIDTNSPSLYGRTVIRTEVHLTSRQMAVLRLLADGNSSADIAVHLGISRGTVSSHIAGIRDQLQITGRRVDLVAEARSRGILSA